MAERNDGRARRTERIRFRIGVNLGDVIVEDGDLYGDGVNIAARLEALGRAGRHLRLGHRARACAEASSTCGSSTSASSS